MTALPRARKRFGQHFLEARWVDKVVRAIDPDPADVFLEVGPGRGALTRALAAAVARVTAFEIDRDLAAHLEAARIPGVAVVAGDFLERTADEVRSAMHVPPGARLRAAGNLPYNVASPILFHLMALRRGGLPVRDAAVMLQREVGDRLLARPGSRDYGVLTVLVGWQARVDRLLDLPPGAFRPAPRVRSTLVRLTFHAPDPPARDPAAFEATVKAVFTRRRKTLANALAALPLASPASTTAALTRAGIDGRRRPETLTIPELVRVADAVGPEPAPTAPPRAVL